MKYLYARPWLTFIFLLVILGLISTVITAKFLVSFPLIFATALLSSGLTYFLFQWYFIRPIKIQLVKLNDVYFDRDKKRKVDLSILNRIAEKLALTASKIEGVSRTCSQFAIAGAEVSFASDILANRVKEQLKKVEQLIETSSIVTQNIEAAAEESNHLSDLSSLTSDASRQGQEAIESANQDMRRTDEQVKSVSGLINSLNDQISQIFNITHEINSIADQTNLLALNASIEAARAGEHGRGFAVVADEVRNLATRTTSSTSEISEMIQGINQGTAKLSTAMTELVSAVADTVEKTDTVNTYLENINSQAEKVDEKVQTSKERADQNQQHQAAIALEFEELASELNATQSDVEDVSGHSSALSSRAENIYELLGEEGLFGEHKVVLKRAQEAVLQIEAVFEQSIQENTISMDSLFDRNYQVIPSTNPVKHRTLFDEFTDIVLPAIQEPLLDEACILFAGAVDENGYFPTHNKCYSQPLTGNYQQDLVNNRTKRIFNDPTGSRCGSHDKPFLIQTYKRDTGEIVHDLSVPIYVQGKKWGGFRVGYTSEKE